MHQGFFKVGFDLYDEPYWTAQHPVGEDDILSATFILNIALPTRDGCNTF